MSEKEKAKVDAKDVNLIGEYNLLLKEIPWENLTSLPKKLGKIGNIIPGLSFDPEDVDIITPIKKVVNYVGILVKRLRSLEKKIVKMEARLDDSEKSG